MLRAIFFLSVIVLPKPVDLTGLFAISSFALSFYKKYFGFYKISFESERQIVLAVYDHNAYCHMFN